MKIQRTIICTFLWSISFLGIIAQNNKYFVDMGVRADNGDVLLWANGDLASLKDGSFVILEQDQIGDTYGWGDITGKAVGTNLSQYGGVNPSVEISGNPSFDITTSKLGSEYRLPTYKEIERLVKNSRISTFKARRNLPAIDSYGVPTWIYGQWMWQGGGNWHSIKFDGPIANIISSDKGRITTTYEGVYKYKDGILYIGNLKLSADKERNVLSADNGGFFIKVSSQSDEAEIEYYVIESKINHNKLYFPLYRKTQHLSSNNGYMAVFDTPNRDRIGYWSGSLLTVEGKQGGIYLLMDSRYFQPQIDNRYEHYRIRPVKTVKGSEEIERKKQQMEEEAKRLVETKRLIEEQRIKQDKKEAEEKYRKAFLENPILSLLDEIALKIKNENFFDYIVRNKHGHYEVYACANQNTKKLCTYFWERIQKVSMKAKNNTTGDFALSFDWYEDCDGILAPTYREWENGRPVNWQKNHEEKKYIIKESDFPVEYIKSILEIMNNNLQDGITKAILHSNYVIKNINENRGNLSTGGKFLGCIKIEPLKPICNSKNSFDADHLDYMEFKGIKTRQFPFLYKNFKKGTYLYRISIPQKVITSSEVSNRLRF